MALLNLPSILTPTLRKDASPEEFLAWGQSMSSTIRDLQQNLESVVEAFISSQEQIGTDVIVADAIVAGSIQAQHITVTGAVITQAIQVQDAIITNAKVVDLESQKVFVTGNTAQTLTTAGSTLILPGLLQISGGGATQKAIRIKGTALGTQDTGPRSFLINGVEQYTATADTARGLTVCRLDTAGDMIVGSLKSYDTFASTADQDGLAAALAFDGSAGETFVLSSYRAIGTGVTAGNLGILLRQVGIDANSLEGIFATGGNGGGPSRIPFVGMGARGIGNGAGVTVFNNGSTDAGAAEYTDWLVGNIPAAGSSPQFNDVTVIEGGSIRAASITAGKLSVSQLSAITADMGTLNAGEIRGGFIVGPVIGSSTNAAALGGVYMTTGGFFLYSSSGVNTGYMAPSGAGFLGSSTSFFWTPSGAVSIAGATFSSGSISASSLNVTTLSAITADMGKLTAGEIVGGAFYTATTGSRVEITGSGIKGYNGANQRMQLSNDGSGWMGSNSAFTWTTGGAVTMDGARLSNTSVPGGKIVDGDITSQQRQAVGTQAVSHSQVNAGTSIGQLFTHGVGFVPLMTVIDHSVTSTVLFTDFSGVTSTQATIRAYNYGISDQTAATVTIAYW